MIPLVLAALTLAPIGMPLASGGVSGYLQSDWLPQATINCQPGDICAKAKIARHSCYFVNVVTSTTGGNPLAIDSTQTSRTSDTYVYWINNTNNVVVVKRFGSAYYECKG